MAASNVRHRHFAENREAVKNDGSLTFVCRPCLVKENISEDDDGPPVLELSIPVHNESQDETMIYEQPPLLELSAYDMYMIETILDDSHFQDTSIIEDMYMPETREEISAITENLIHPLADSTSISQFEEFDDFDVSGPAFDDEISFDITDRDVEPVIPIAESSMHDMLTETVIEDGPITYTIIDGGSQKKTGVLISSLGYAYGIKRRNKSSVVWRCTSRSRSINYPVIVKQEGLHFTQKHEHLHPSSTDNDLNMDVYMKTRTKACEQVYRPAMDIVEEILLDNDRPFNTAGLKKSLLKRIANRAQAALRPE